MPYVDLLSTDDYTSLFYWTNTTNGNVGSFDPEKPTIVMMHPQHMDIRWLYPQLDDPRLRENYNIIAFDTRVTGRSVYRFNGKYDLWVTAADLAHAFHNLGLPPSHLFASEVFCFAACRFAALFPDLCLSMTLCNVPAETEMKAFFDAFDELTQLWGYAEDLETFEHANNLLLSYCAGPTSPIETQDEIVAYWQTEYPPWRRSHIIAFAQVVLNRTGMTPTELAAITTPTLVIQADKNPLYPMQNAENLQKALVGVPGGAMIFSVKAEIGFLTIFSSSIVNQTFSKFLARQPRTRSDLNLRVESCDSMMRLGLERLAAFKVDSSFLSRDAKSPLSFSCVTDEIKRSQDGAVAVYSKGQRGAWSPLGMDGRPLRKFSERGDHTLQDGYSIIEKRVSPKDERPSKEDKKRAKAALKASKHKPVSPPHSPPRSTAPLPAVELIDSELVSLTQQQVARTRRMMVDPAAHGTDQHVIKGSLTKVMAPHYSTPLNTFNRMLR